MTSQTHSERTFVSILVALILGALFSGFLAVTAPIKARAQTVATYVGVHAGYGIATTELGVSGLGSLDGIGQKGLIGGIHGGVDVFLPGSTIFVGAFGSYDWQHLDTKLSAPTIPFSASARIGDAWTVGGRVGLQHGKVKPYLMLGYTQAETSISVPGIAMPTLKGLTYGGGLDYALANNLAVGAEARWTRFDAAQIDTSPINMKPEELSVMMRLSLSFGNPVANSPAPLK